MTSPVFQPMSNLSAVDGLSISQMEQELTTRTISSNGYAITAHKIQPGFETHEWFSICKLFHVERGAVVRQSLAYYNNDRDALTCPYHLLNVPGPNAEWGVEVEWYPAR